MNKTSKKAQENLPKTVSVIIPYYNGSKWIDRALISVFDQTIKADEVIVVNDGSTIEEQSAIDALSKQYPFTLIHKENGGQGSARNVGVAASTANYISFLDQDDFYLPHHIEDLLEALPERDNRLGFVYADLMEGDEDGNIIDSNFLRQQQGRHPKQGHVYQLLRYNMCVLPSASLISKKAFDAIGGFDEQFIGYEDDDLFLRFFRAGYSNYYRDKPVTVWCIRKNSSSYSISMLRSALLYFKKLAIEFPSERDFRKALFPRFKSTFISWAKKAVMNNITDQYEAIAILREYICFCRSKRVNLIYLFRAYRVLIALECMIILRKGIALCSQKKSIDA